MADFIKLDMGCRSDTSIHDGTVKASLERVRDGLNATGRPILFYIDAGNPTSGPKVSEPGGCTASVAIPVEMR